ncbi:hypothetical protein LIER_27660 [Lithospermum erythrorhizon]|uniref:Uncharacterized protein n=1 Tax=Lithospermum erythrorhizon TaxID=34254 RepID=A0AAV3RD45_LITER
MSGTTLSGRTQGTEFKELDILWTDSLSDLAVCVVHDNGRDTKYHYAGISSNLPVIRGSQLLALGINGDQPFCNFDCYSSAPAAPIHQLVENFSILDRMTYYDYKYLPIYGLGDGSANLNSAGTDIFIHKYGTGIFDKCGLIGVASLFFDEPLCCFATPVTRKVIKRFEKSDEFKEYLAKKL